MGHDMYNRSDTLWLCVDNERFSEFYGTLRNFEFVKKYQNFTELNFTVRCNETTTIYYFCEKCKYGFKPPATGELWTQDISVL